MGQIVDTRLLEWQPVRPDVTRGVEGKTLLAGEVKIVITRVVPGGGFSMVSVGETQFEARPGVAVRVAVGEPHAYENTGPDEMLLISINLPRSQVL